MPGQGGDAIILVRVIESGMAAHENIPYKMLIPTQSQPLRFATARPALWLE